MKVYLYSTQGCHLCERAKEVLWPVLAIYQCKLVEKDIADEDLLIERYGTRIPVLITEDLCFELDWPFDAEEAKDFLARQRGQA